MIVFIFNRLYDVFLGGDFLQKTGININYTECQIEWLNGQLLLRITQEFHKEDMSLLVDMLYAQEDEEWFGDEFMELLATTILDATYNKVDLDKVINDQKHLNKKQRRELKKVLIKCEKLFDGTLGVYPHRKVHIELLADTVTKHVRPYAVPQVHLEAFRKELLRLCKLDVLEPIGESEWAHPSFITSKKIRTVCWISNLRELNKVIK